MPSALSRRDLLAAASTSMLASSLSAAPAHPLLFIGTYSREDSKGVYSARFDEKAGKFSPLTLAAETANPSFLTLHPNGRFLYAVGELGEFRGQKSGSVGAFSVDRESGTLKALNAQPTGGTSPCHLVVDRTEKNLIVVNYGTGSTAVFRVNGDGTLGERTSFIQHTGTGPNARRQQGPHAHSINLAPSNRWGVVADLGTDEYIIYGFDAASGKIERHSAAKVKGGLGPRHFTFHPNGKQAYGVNEMGSSVTVFDWNDARGTLTETQTISTLPGGFQAENNCAEVLVHPNGRFVYASNRGHDSIAVFAVDAAKGTLSSKGQVATQGKVPRNFRITPSGNWLLAANQNSANVVVFRVEADGGLTPNGETLKVAYPVCLRFLV